MWGNTLHLQWEVDQVGAFHCAAITEMYSYLSKELSRDQYQGLEFVLVYNVSIHFRAELILILVSFHFSDLQTFSVETFQSNL